MPWEICLSLRAQPEIAQVIGQVEREKSDFQKWEVYLQNE